MESFNFFIFLTYNKNIKPKLNWLINISPYISLHLFNQNRFNMPILLEAEALIANWQIIFSNHNHFSSIFNANLHLIICSKNQFNHFNALAIYPNVIIVKNCNHFSIYLPFEDCQRSKMESTAYVLILLWLFQLLYLVNGSEVQKLFFKRSINMSDPGNQFFILSFFLSLLPTYLLYFFSLSFFPSLFLSINFILNIFLTVCHFCKMI